MVVVLFLFLFFSVCESSNRLSLPKKHIVVVGAGWAGWGASKSLCEAGFQVTLVDSLNDPAGLSVGITRSGKPFEPGHKGFWIDYPNIMQLLKNLNINEDSVFTPFTNSTFHSPFGVEATAPVFSASSFPELPSPIGQVLATFSLFERLPIEDRASIIGLLYAMLDMDRNEKVFAAYDRMTAHDLFIRMGISKRLVDDFIRPTLLVGLFKPPEELSAALVMELLYYYALAHQTSFDVRWLKTGTIANTFFAPLYKKLHAEYNLTLLSSSRVDSVVVTAANDDQINEKSLYTVRSIKYSQYNNKTGQTCKEELPVDGAILALGAKGLSAVMKGSPALARISPQLSKAASMGSIDCIACRLWLDKTHRTRSPSNVFSRFDALRGAGGTFFMLDQLHAEHLDELWGDTKQTITERGSVIAVDFYNAGALIPLSDEDILKTITEQLLPAAIPSFQTTASDEVSNNKTTVLDFCVERFPGAVTWFSPGSYEKRPRTAVQEVGNLFCAGDWMVMSTQPVDPTTVSPFALETSSAKDRPLKRLKDLLTRRKEQSLSPSSVTFKSEEHGAKGLCQERAYVSGLFAANKMAQRLLPQSPPPAQAEILPVRDDELQVQLGRLANKRLSELFRPLGITISPWLR